ncbi:metal-dependent hydrolase [Acidithiobacillus sp.]|uniref:metal-dependent hydrolase n=1 Tax=Acidithiobacillus sp. TaxID=1872118 RepID=UPI002626410D|nr:metal-dependent hydrolase [Acidithiobacillus sp.]MDD5280458.1 metal-dependent hydrolase [Acidithiobacillus sp.]
MGPTGHRLTGIAAGCLAAAALYPLLNDMSLAAIPAGYVGGTAPDWLEVAHAEFSSQQQRWVRQSLIPHRTITHWWPLWLALLILVIAWPVPAWIIAPGLFNNHSLFTLNLAPLLRAVVAGFTAGGIMHLFMDVPNPSGIPILTPMAHSRWSLYWWKSGNALEPLAGLGMAAIAAGILWLAIH